MNDREEKDRIDIWSFCCGGGGRERVRKAVIGSLMEMRELPQEQTALGMVNGEKLYLWPSQNFMGFLALTFGTYFLSTEFIETLHSTIQLGISKQKLRLYFTYF